MFVYTKIIYDVNQHLETCSYFIIVTLKLFKDKL